MILVVLMQRPRSEGLGSAFGGGLTDNVFGSQTTNVLARFTTWMGIAFFAITLLLSILTARANSGKTAVQKKLLSEPVPAAISNPTPDAQSTPGAAPTATATPVAEPAQETPKATPEVETAPLEPAPEASPEATTPAQN